MENRAKIQSSLDGKNIGKRNAAPSPAIAGSLPERSIKQPDAKLVGFRWSFNRTSGTLEGPKCF